MKRNDVLKLIAMITMLIDHIGVLLLPELLFLRTIGRIAFPIFAYQLAMGFIHTSNRKKYGIRLLSFGLLSQIPYSFLNYEFEFAPYHFNVILLFLYTTGVLYILEKSINFRKNKEYFKFATGMLLVIFAIILPEYLDIMYDDFMFSYGGYGILMTIIFYQFKDNWVKISVSYIVLSFAYAYHTGAIYLAMYSPDWIGYTLNYIESLMRYDIVLDNITNGNVGLWIFGGYFFQARSVMALPIIYAANKKTVRLSLNRYVGYAFYPAHLFVLVIIRYMIETI